MNLKELFGRNRKRTDRPDGGADAVEELGRRRQFEAADIADHNADEQTGGSAGRQAERGGATRDEPDDREA